MKKISLVLIGCCLLFISLELSLRLAGFKLCPFNETESVERYFWLCDKNLGFRNRPNGSYSYKIITPTSICTTDKHGFRNGFAWYYHSDSPIILFIGDSTIFCAEVNDDETGPSEIAKLLNHEFNVRVLNGGVRGYNTLQAKRMLGECLDHFPEIIAVVYVYCDNDYYENTNPDIYYPARAPTTKWSNGKLQLVEVTKPTVPWGQSYTKQGISIKKQIRIKISNYVRSFSVVVHHSLIDLRKILEICKVIDSVNYYDEIKLAQKSHADEILEELLRQMNQKCQNRRITFLTTSFFNGVNRLGIEYTDYSVICKRAAVNYINIKDNFVDDPLSYITKNCDGTYDEHYNQKGTKTFAKGLTPTLKSIVARKKISGI